MDTSLRTAIALSLTVGVGYGLCTVLFAVWPESAATFMNSLFHGLDFRKLQSGTTLFSFGSFAYALIVMMAWAFGLGFIFAKVRALIGSSAP